MKMKKIKICSFISLFVCLFGFVFFGIKSNAAQDNSSNKYGNVEIINNETCYIRMAFHSLNNSAGSCDFYSFTFLFNLEVDYNDEYYFELGNLGYDSTYSIGIYLWGTDGNINYDFDIGVLTNSDVLDFGISSDCDTLDLLYKLPKNNSLDYDYSSMPCSFNVSDFQLNPAWSYQIVVFVETDELLVDYEDFDAGVYTPYDDYIVKKLVLNIKDNYIDYFEDENASIASLQQQVEQLTQDKTILSSTVQEKEAQITSLQAEVEQLTQDKTTLNTSVSEKEATITSLQQQITQLNEEKIALNSSIQEKENKIKELEKEILDLKEVETEKPAAPAVPNKNEKTNYFEQHKTAIIVSSVSAGILLLAIAAGIVFIIKRK